MSTKTLRKRIALVAVSALTAGVLSVASAPVANAAAGDVITAPDIFVAAAASAGSADAIGQCAIASSALAASISTVNSTGTVLAVGAVIKFDTTSNGEGQLRVTGPAKLSLGGSAPSTATISQDAKAVGFEKITTDVARLEVTGAGDITVTAYNLLTIGSGSAVKTFSITGVDTCASGATPVAANTILEIASSGGSPSAGGATGDATLTYAQKDYKSVVYIRTALRNQYKADVTTAGVLTAESSNPNALLQFDGSNGNVGPTAFLAGTVVGQSGSVDLEVSQNTVLAPGAALSTTITFKFNGVTVGTKTVSILGAPASIVVDQADVTIGNSDSGNDSGTFKYLVKDAAGNNLGDGATATLVAATGITAAAASFVSAGIVSDAKSATGADGSTKGTGTYDCAAFAVGTSSGSQKVTLGFLSGTTLVKSNEFTATCGGAAVGSFTFAMDKAVYSPGEIATVTFTAKDLNGGVTSDAAVIGAAFNQISIPGMTIIGSAITSADVFTSGTKTYKFRVDQAEGSFVGQGQVTVSTSAATAEKTVKTSLFSIKASGTSVTNAEVLKSIVALIASINKQIQALQKLILKR
jgi:hypothetical protein